jgi:drug/metabolite transporter (DMT)-like permease
MTGPGRLSRNRVVAVLIATEFGLAATNVIAKDAFGVIGPLQFEMVRRSGAALLLTAFALFRGESLRPRRLDIKEAVVPGVLGMALGRGFLVLGLSMAPATSVALIDSTTPTAALLLASMIGADYITRRRLAGSAVSLLGIVLLMLLAGIDGVGFKGGLVALGSPIMWGLAYAVASTATSSPVRQVALMSATGAIVLAGGGLLTGTAELPPLGAVLAPGMAVAVGVAVVENLVVLVAARAIGVAQATSFEYLVPVFTAALALAFLGEPILVGQLVAGAALVAGVAIGADRKAPAEQAVEG